MITEQKRDPLTLAQLAAVAASPTGFMNVTPQGARELLAEMRERTAELANKASRSDLYMQLANDHAHECERLQLALEANATLERVRALISPHYYEGTMIHATRLVKALASQPEAPACTSPGGVGDCYDIDCPSPVCNPPEAPKGPAAEAELNRSVQSIAQHTEYLRAELAAAKALASQVLHSQSETLAQMAQLVTDLAAANARIAQKDATIADERRICGDQEKRIRGLERMVYDLGVAGDAANARADAAEAERCNAVLEWYEARDRADAAERELNSLTDNAAVVLDERDQLAARVAELEAMIPHPGDGSCEKCGFAPATDGLCPDCTCTPEERKVLEALMNAAIETEGGRNRRRHRFESEKQEHELCVAELANRAAKAKRGGA